MFVQEGLIAETVSKGVRHFWIPSLDLLKQYVLKHEQKYRSLDEQFTYIQTSFESLDKNNQTLTPKLQLYEHQSGIKSLFEDILLEISKQ